MALYGVVGLLLLIVEVWVVLQILSSSETTGMKALWAALVLLFPLIGLIVWAMAGPRGRANP